MTVGADGALYVTTERNNADNANPLNSILRFDPSQSGTQLIATDQWNLTSEFPELHAGNKTEANLGFEGVTYVPDSYLTANGFVDQSTGLAYRPADYPSHGTGLYFAALENDGKLYAYALNSDHSYHRVAVVDTGMGHVMDVQYNADTQRIWALCDNTCGVASTVLKVDEGGAMVPQVVYSKPAGLPVNNLEGFALAPDSTCTAGTKEVVWSDDGVYGAGPGSATEGHALYSGRISCDLELGGQGASNPTTPAPSLTLGASAGAIGDRITVTGAHFAAGTRVTLTFNSTPIGLGSATSGPDGNLTFAFAVPSVPAGSHTVTASVGGTIVASAGFSVTGTGAGAHAAGDPTLKLASTGSDLSIDVMPTALVLLVAGGIVLLLRRRKGGAAARG
jgi:hypothetical protein